jgi:heme/copper-type cytochrome/quinol oxidase subunit 1
MNRLIKKPHLIFLFTIPILMIKGVLCDDAQLDINVHDTYFVITHFHLTILISILFGIIGIGYWMMQKMDRKLSRFLNWAHIGLTFGGPLIIFILAQLYREEIIEYEFNNNLSLIIYLIFILVILGQIIFPINIIYGLIKKSRNANN